MYLTEFCERYDYPDEAKKLLTNSYDVLCKNEHFMNVLKEFYENEELTESDVASRLELIRSETGINKYTVSLLFYILLSKQLKIIYDNLGIDEVIFYTSMDDLRCKLFECHEVFGIWGSFVPGWLYGFFRLKRFGIGRLQFELSEYGGKDICVSGKLVQKGQRVINCHIPSSGKPFDKPARAEAYKKAYEFFKKEVGEEAVFMCCSWLMYPKNKIILKEGSNILSFMDDFTIVSSDISESGEDLWRIFGKIYDGKVETLPEDTSLQRAYKDWLKKGNKSGVGVGVFIYR